MLLLIPAPRWSVLLEYFFGYGDRGHRAWPAGVERQVGDRFDQLILCHAVFQRQGEVRSKLIGAIHCDERAHCRQAAIPSRQPRTRPHIAKQHVVSELGQFGGDVAEHSLGRRGLHIGADELFHDFSPMLAQLKRGYRKLPYCSSVTFSIQSTTFPLSSSWIAIWVMAVVGDAPCQCFSPGGHQITSPGRISLTGPPQLCTKPQPHVTTSVWPRGCVCQLLRAHGSNVT